MLLLLIGGWCVSVEGFGLKEEGCVGCVVMDTESVCFAQKEAVLAAMYLSTADMGLADKPNEMLLDRTIKGEPKEAITGHGNER